MSEKQKTKYDRKMEERRLEEEKKRKNRIISRAVGAAICVCIVCVIIYSIIAVSMNKKSALNDPYITVGEHKVTMLEYDYYFKTIVNSYINAYSSILSYIGLDTSVDFAKQQYTDTMTWQDFFDQMTIVQVKEVKALMDDAKANGFVYDDTEDYNNFKENLAAGAEESGLKIANYYKTFFGQYATENNVQPFVKETILASAYRENLLEQNKPSDETITTHYEENKKDYDKVDYRSFVFEIDVADDASEAEIEAAMSEQKAKAEEMKNRLVAGESFEELCIEYALEDEKEDYEDEESEYSLSEDNNYTDIDDIYADWLYEEGRTDGDITVLEDDADQCYYVIEFVKRVYDEDTNQTISDELAEEEVTKYVNDLLTNYEAKDIKGKLNSLVLEVADEEETDSSDEE